jgi:hypothetical protein
MDRRRYQSVQPVRSGPQQLRRAADDDGEDGDGTGTDRAGADADE